MACLPRKVILKTEVGAHEHRCLPWPPLLFSSSRSGDVISCYLHAPKKEGRLSTPSLSTLSFGQTPCPWISQNQPRTLSSLACSLSDLKGSKTQAGWPFAAQVAEAQGQRERGHPLLWVKGQSLTSLFLPVSQQ